MLSTSEETVANSGRKCQNIMTGRKLNESHKIFTFHAGQQLRLPGPCQYSISEP